MKRIIFSGATSGTGVRVAQHLARKFGAENITCLARPTSEIAPLRELNLNIEIGDVTDGVSLQRLLSAETIYLDMTHPKFYPQSLDTIVNSGVKRVYFITTTGIFSKYHHCSDIYKDGEEKIRSSGLTYTILRPSMIYGSLRDKNMNRLIKVLNRAPVFPLFGAGRALMQPVFVDDLANGIVAAIDNPATENNDYNLAGPSGIPYRAIVETIAKTLEKRVTMLHVGLPLASSLVRFAQYVPGFPISHEQVLRLLEDKVFDISKARHDLEYHPRSFSEGIAAEVAEMKVVGAL